MEDQDVLGKKANGGEGRVSNFKGINRRLFDFGDGDGCSRMRKELERLIFSKAADDEDRLSIV